jgi:hypothetical protein
MVHYRAVVRAWSTRTRGTTPRRARARQWLAEYARTRLGAVCRSPAPSPNRPAATEDDSDCLLAPLALPKASTRTVSSKGVVVLMAG